MKLVPDNLRCDQCQDSAVIKLHDQESGIDRLYCRAHKPELWPGRYPHLSVLRFRSAPDSITSRMLAMPEETPEHAAFRQEMCELLILRGQGACKYYLSKLTGSDQFALWNDEFIDNAREFILAATQGAAKLFTINFSTIGAFRALFKQAFEESRGVSASTLTRPERGVVILANHPLWSDETIAAQVPTTAKQLRRNSEYHQVRAAMYSP